MTRPLRLQLVNGHYHVTARGNGRRDIFVDDLDRQALLTVLGRTVERFGWRCLTYCLMDNHLHLLVRTPEANLARGMQQLKSSYAQMFNRRHERVGHLFAGRYGSRLVQRDAHLLQVFRYIARNPVGVLAPEPTAWPWSAHAALAGLAPAPAFLAAEEAWAWFGGPGTPCGAAARYRTFVDEEPPEPPVDMNTGGAAIGEPRFLRTVLPAVRPSSEIARREWGEGRPPLSDLLDRAGAAASIARAYRHHGYTLSAIAEHLGCHVSTVSRRLRAYERMLDCKI